MENVSHLFTFKGKLQTNSLSPPKMWFPPSPSHTTLSAIDLPFCPNWGTLNQTCRRPHLAAIVCAETGGPLAFVHITKPLATIHANADKILGL